MQIGNCMMNFFQGLHVTRSSETGQCFVIPVSTSLTEGNHLQSFLETANNTDVNTQMKSVYECEIWTLCLTCQCLMWVSRIYSSVVGLTTTEAWIPIRAPHMITLILTHSWCSMLSHYWCCSMLNHYWWCSMLSRYWWCSKSMLSYKW